MSKACRVFLVSLVCLVLLASVPARAQDSPVLLSSALLPPRNPGFVLRKNVDEIHLTFTVTGKDKRPVLGLRPEQIALRDNRRAVEAIVDFRADAGLPLQLALMMDASGSMEKQFALQQRLALEFVRQVVRPGADRALLIAFGRRREQLAGGNADPEEFARAIKRMHAGGITALYDALLTSCEQLAKFDPGPARRAIVLFSDGDDNYSFHTLQDVIAQAQRADTPVYAINVHNARHRDPGDDVLRTLASVTGGRAFIISKPGQLGNAFAEIEQELRSQYVVAFRPSPEQRDGGFHALQVKVVGLPDAEIRARAGYWAPAEDGR